MRRHEVDWSPWDWDRWWGSCECCNEHSVDIKCGEFIGRQRTCWLLQNVSAPWHWINTTQCRLRMQKAELTAVPSCCRISSSVPSVSIPLSSSLCCVISNPWRCQCHVPTNIDLFLYTKAVFLLRQPFTARDSGKPPAPSCRNRGAATAVPTVCSEQASILHHIWSFISYVYVFLRPVAVDSMYKQ